MGRLNKRLDPTLVGQEAEQLTNDLRKRVIGQDEALRSVVDAYQMNLAGLSTPGRPIGNFLFLGPTGTGKTRTVEALAESLVGDLRAVIKIDCAEFQHSHEIAKLIGSPPGYLGHRETHPLLSQEVLNQYHTDKIKVSFVLFDEIEKASDALWNLLLGILDKATLTLGDNRRVDFQRAMIFMTSNLGAERMIKTKHLGFYSEDDFLQLKAKIGDIGMNAARARFKPEFMNRIDKVVVFQPLDEPTTRLIMKNELNTVQQRIFTSANAAPFVFQVTSSAEDFIMKHGYSLEYNARHLKRTIERALVHPLSNLLATKQIQGGDLIRVEWEAGAENLSFIKEAEAMPAYAMAQMVDASVSLPQKDKPSATSTKR